MKASIVGGVFLSLILGFTQSSFAATITVQTLEDNPAGENLEACSLRDAIMAANTDTETKYCAGGNGQDEIVFHPSLNGVISILNALPAITQSVSIVGNATAQKGGQQITINAGGQHKLLVVDAARFIVSNMRLIGGLGAHSGTTDGDDNIIWDGKGGALELAPRLELLEVDNVYFEGNAAEGTGGAIHLTRGAGSMIIRNSVFSKNAIAANAATGGGAIFIHPLSQTGQLPTYRFENTDFLGNVAARIDSATNLVEPDGGAILIKGPGSSGFRLGFDGTEFRGNMADGNGGAISLQATSAVIGSGPSINLGNTIFSNNSANRNGDAGGTGDNLNNAYLP